MLDFSHLSSNASKVYEIAFILSEIKLLRYSFSSRPRDTSRFIASILPSLRIVYFDITESISAQRVSPFSRILSVCILRIENFILRKENLFLNIIKAFIVLILWALPLISWIKAKSWLDIMYYNEEVCPERVIVWHCSRMCLDNGERVLFSLETNC